VDARLRTWTAGCAFVALLVVSGAGGARLRSVPLTVTLVGKGVVRLSDGRQFTCNAEQCQRRFALRAGTKITLRAQAARAWKFTGWRGACRRASGSCSVRLNGATHIAAWFARPGARVNPIPLAQAAVLSDGWVVRVASATLDATSQILARPGNTPPSAGAQFTLVDVSATYTGSGSSRFDPNDDRLQTIGARDAAYDEGCGSNTLPGPPLDGHEGTAAGQTVAGELCFEIAQDDAASLLLSMYDERYSHYVWFALRP
jgi:hypothetical protein